MVVIKDLLVIWKARYQDEILTIIEQKIGQSWRHFLMCLGFREPHIRICGKNTKTRGPTSFFTPVQTSKANFLERKHLVFNSNFKFTIVNVDSSPLVYLLKRSNPKNQRQPPTALNRFSFPKKANSLGFFTLFWVVFTFYTLWKYSSSFLLFTFLINLL